MSSRPFFARATFVLVALASLFLLVGSASAQVDPDYTIRLVCPTDISAANEGDSVEIQVRYDALAGLGGFSLGFQHNSSELEITSGSAGAALQGLSGTFLQTVNQAENTGLFGFLNFNPFAPIPAGTDLHMFSLWVQVPAGVTPQCVTVDSVFVPPAGPWTVTIQEGSLSVRPGYVACNGAEINVKGGCDVGNVPPNAICQNIQLSADANCEADGSIDNGSNDPDGSIVATRQEPPGPYALGVTPVTLWVTDDFGDSASCAAEVTVVDDTDPVVTCPANVTVDNDAGICGAVVSFAATATDNCDADVAISYSQDPDTEFPVGVTTVTVTATDDAGNTAQCTFDVTVNDAEAPVAQCPVEPIIEVAAPGATSAVVNFALNATDNCAVTGLSSDPVSGTAFPLGTTTVTVTAEDAAGNAGQCTFDVTVLAPPVVSDIPDQTIEQGGSFAQIILDDFVEDLDNLDTEIAWNATMFKSLGVISVEIVDRVATINVTPDFTGSAVFEFTATDPDNNSDSDQATFTVNTPDNEPPVVSDIPDQTVSAGDPFVDIILDDFVADPDNLDTEIMWTSSGATQLTVQIVDRVATITYPGGFIGAETITFNAADPGGLFDNDQATFTVEEVLNPDFEVLASPDSVFVPEGTASNFAYDVVVTSIDGFDGDVTLSVTGLPGDATSSFSVNPVTAPGSSTLSGVTTDLTPAGVYEVTITGMDGVPKLVDHHDAVVYLVVEEQGCTDEPIPVVSQDVFNITITEGETAADEIFYVTNGASCGALFWEAMATDAWVSPDPTSGSVDAGETPGDLVTLNFNTASLAPDNYVAQVNVVAVLPGTGKSDEGATVVINLTVEPMGESLDTVYVSSAVGYPGSDVMIEVDFKNDEELAAMSLGLLWDSEDVNLDSVSYMGSRVDYIGSKVTTIDNVDNELALGVLRVPPEVLIPVGSGLWAKLWFSIDPSAAPQIVMIDSTFIPPGVELLFNDEMANPIYPQFVKGEIEILPQQDICISGTVEDDVGAPIEGATVELYDDLGNLLATTISDAAGFYEFCVDGSMMGDLFTVRAYLPGYYPDSENANAPAEDADLVLMPIMQVVQPTYEWVDLYCDGAAYGTDGPVLPGDVIEAYDPDGVLCGSWIVSYAGTFGFMPVYVDDPFTPGIDEGCVVGDEITLMWNGLPVILTGSPNPLIWTGNGDRYSACFEVETDVTKCIELNEGWNLISFNVELPLSDIEALFASVMDNVDVILSFESMAQTYDPDLPEFSTLWNIDNAHGYWFRMDAPDEICITGALVDECMPIGIELNWNLVSYLPTDPRDVPTALQSIFPSVIVVLGYEGGGLTYDPAEPGLSDLTEMKECFGYWVKTDAPGTLVYCDIPVFAGNDPDATHTLASYVAKVNVTNTWVSLYGSNVTLNGETLKTGSTISAYNEAGSLIGEYTVRQDGKFGFMPLYGPENFTADIAKVANAGKVSFKIDGVDVVQTVDWSNSGDRIELNQFTTEKGATLPTSFTLAQNYPNPFNPQTTIDYVVAAPGNVTIEIYNTLGQRIKTLVNDQHAAGTYSVTWHGRTDSGAQVASGIYLYKMTAGDYSETRKMTLLK